MNYRWDGEGWVSEDHEVERSSKMEGKFFLEYHDNCHPCGLKYVRSYDTLEETKEANDTGGTGSRPEIFKWDLESGLFVRVAHIGTGWLEG